MIEVVIMRLLSKIKRELIVFFSKICVKSARNDYFGLDLRYPVIYGMGRGYAIPKEVWMGQCLKAFVESKKGCVIDVGVNVGVYLVKLKAITDDVEYFGFEPNAVCNYYTNELIRMNGFRNAKVLPLALSNEMAVKTLYASKPGDKGASLVSETKKNANVDYSSDIVTVKGDDFIELLNIEDVAAIKIDVEGAELFVLNGLNKTIEIFRPFFYIEIWTGEADRSTRDRLSRIYDFISSKNYSVLEVKSNKIIEFVGNADGFFDQYDPNYIFIPNELIETFKSNLNSIDECLVHMM